MDLTKLLTEERERYTKIISNINNLQAEANFSLGRVNMLEELIAKATEDSDSETKDNENVEIIEKVEIAEKNC